MGFLVLKASEVTFLIVILDIKYLFVYLFHKNCKKWAKMSKNSPKMAI